MRISPRKISEEMQRMKETGKIDGTVGGTEVGRIIDHHNSLAEKKKEKDFSEEITVRNKYYWKLWKSAIQDMKNGIRPKQNVSRIKPSKSFSNKGNGVISS